MQDGPGPLRGRFACETNRIDCSPHAARLRRRHRRHDPRSAGTRAPDAQAVSHRLVDGVLPPGGIRFCPPTSHWTATSPKRGCGSTVPATVLVTVAYAMTFAFWSRPGRIRQHRSSWGPVVRLTRRRLPASAGRPLRLGSCSVLLPRVQAARPCGTTYRTPAPRGIAPGTWAIALAEGLLWGYYGWFYAMPADVVHIVARIACRSDAHPLWMTPTSLAGTRPRRAHDADQQHAVSIGNLGIIINDPSSDQNGRREPRNRSIHSTP